TLVALEAALDRHATGEERADSLAPELASLARDVREATDRAAALSRDIVAGVARASGRLQQVQERVSARFQSIASRPAAVAPATPAPAGHRLVERLREMVDDAARKAELLSGSCERASTIADGLVRRLEEEALAMEMLATSVGATP